MSVHTKWTTSCSLRPVIRNVEKSTRSLSFARCEESCKVLFAVLARKRRDPAGQMQLPGDVRTPLTLEKLRDDDHVVDDRVGGHVLILHEVNNEPR